MGKNSWFPFSRIDSKLFIHKAMYGWQRWDSFVTHKSKFVMPGKPIFYQKCNVVLQNHQLTQVILQKNKLVPILLRKIILLTSPNLSPSTGCCLGQGNGGGGYVKNIWLRFLHTKFALGKHITPVILQKALLYLKY